MIKNIIKLIAVLVLVIGIYFVLVFSGVIKNYSGLEALTNWRYKRVLDPEAVNDKIYNLADIQEYLDKAKQEPERTQVVNLETLEMPQNFISSSMGIGDLSGKSDNIYLRFDRQIIGNESLENFNKYSIPEQTALNIKLKDGGQISLSDEAVWDNIKIFFNKYEDGILTGVLVTKPSASFSWASDNSPNTKCMTGDMIGICQTSRPIDLNLIVNFKVMVE
ncbi:MAG: hypothetical protein WCW61_04455 [Patescibacteria group bacterium]